MLDYVVQEGDEVTITIPKESRDCGYNPYPEGTRATVLGFSEIAWGRLGSCGKQPGIYRNRAWCRIQLEDGSEHTEHTGRLDLVDSDDYKHRVDEWREAGGLNSHGEKQDFIRNLPDTPFWEGDLVRRVEQSHMGVVTIIGPDKPGDLEIFTIVGIQYDRLDYIRNEGSPWPAYDISDKLGSCWRTSAPAHELVLVERGPVWKHFHNEIINFADLMEEANFYRMLGHYDEVRNPANDLFSWTLEEVLCAIKARTVHGICVSQSLFGSGTSVQAIKYHNEELGRRVATATLQELDR